MQIKGGPKNLFPRLNLRWSELGDSLFERTVCIGSHNVVLEQDSARRESVRASTATYGKSGGSADSDRAHLKFAILHPCISYPVSYIHTTHAHVDLSYMIR